MHDMTAIHPYTKKNFNRDLAIQVRDAIELDPTGHDQERWATQTECGTTMCIAGWACVKAGYTLDWESNYEGDVWANTVTEDDGQRRGIGLKAIELLGLHDNDADDLFWADNEDAKKLLNYMIDETAEVK